MSKTLMAAIVSKGGIQLGRLTMITTALFRHMPISGSGRHASVLATAAEHNRCQHWQHARETVRIWQQHQYIEATQGTTRPQLLDPLQYILAGRSTPMPSQNTKEWLQDVLDNKPSSKRNPQRKQVMAGQTKVVSVIREKQGGGHTIEVELTTRDLERLLARAAVNSAEPQISLQHKNATVRTKQPEECLSNGEVFSRTKCHGCKFYNICKANEQTNCR